jgi:predicted nucleotidyltransferase
MDREKSYMHPLREQIVDFCRRAHIKRLSLFGSILRSDFGPESDVDVLVEFEPGHTPGFFGLMEMQEELSNLFGGRKVDIRTSQDLSRYFRAEVEAQAEVQYAQE